MLMLEEAETPSSIEIKMDSKDMRITEQKQGLAPHTPIQVVEDGHGTDHAAEEMEEKPNKDSRPLDPDDQQQHYYGMVDPEDQYQAPSSPESGRPVITDSEDDGIAGEEKEMKASSSYSFLSASSTSDSDSPSDDEPSAMKRMRFVDDVEIAQQLRARRLASYTLSPDGGNPYEPQPMASSPVSPVLSNSIASRESASLQEDEWCNNTGAIAGNSGMTTDGVTPSRTPDLFRDISDVTSISSISISSNEMPTYEDRHQANEQTPRGRPDWAHSPLAPLAHDDWGSPPPFDVEFEVASVSIYSSNPIEDANSSSGLEDEAWNLQTGHTDSSESLTDETENDADEEWEKDKSDDQDSVRNDGGVSDSELSDKDFWHCTQCHAKTNSPYLRYCLRCFRIRRNWLPKRPQPKHSGKKLAKQNRNSRSRNRRHTSSDEGSEGVREAQPDQPSRVVTTSQPVQTTNSLAITTGLHPGLVRSVEIFNSIFQTPESKEMVAGDSSSTEPKSSSTGSHPTSGSSSVRPTSSAYCSTSTENNEFTGDWDCTDGPPSRSSTTLPAPLPVAPVAAPQTETVSAQLLKDVLTRKPIKIKALRKSNSWTEEKETPLCGVCMVRDKDAAFVHGKTAHVYSCYNCADKILKKHGKCPICRKRILRVVKVINS